NEGSTFSQNGSFTDPDANSWTATVDYGDGSGTQALSLVGKTFSLSHVYTDNGTYNVTVTVNDGTASGSDIVVVTVNNVAPTATFNAPSPVDEGSNISLSLTAPSDPSSDDVAAGFTYEFDCGLGAGYELSSSNTRSCPTTDNGSRTVKGKILDKDNGFTEYSATVTIVNVAPTLNSVTGPATPVPVNSSTSITLNFSDPAGSYDSYTAEVNWDDGLGYVSVGLVTSGGSVIKTFTTAGVYTVCAKVSDEDGGTSNESCFAYIVVYDPTGGFVTGGGWIMSPAGAYVADPTMTGKATFGFVSKYERNKTLPQGNTEFNFHAASFEFKSTAYEWLVVAGTRAQYKGTGTITGQTGTYGFLLTAIDGGNTSAGVNPDKFRIKIWQIGGSVVYDNQITAAEDSDAATGLSGGSIVIHTKK
ncbi:MAG TPA: PKD domain-containing protein, partial [Gemmatimonadaceae bacterium]